MNAPSFSREQLLQTALSIAQERTAPKVDVVPDGFLTLEQIAVEWRLSASHATRLLRRLVADGLAETRKFRVPSNRGPYPIPHYRLEEGAIAAITQPD